MESHFDATRYFTTRIIENYEEEYREATQFVFSGQIREWARRHRKYTGEPNDFSHKPKTTLRVRGYLLGFRRALGNRAPVGKKVPTT